MAAAFDIERWIISAVMLLIISALFYVRFTLNKVKKAMKELSLSLGWEFKNSLFSETHAQGEYNGISSLIKYYPGSKYRASYFGIELDIKSTFEIIVSKENFMHKLGKQTGLAKEIQTGDLQFDEKYFLKASNDYNAELYMQKPQVREVVTMIADSGFTINIAENKMKLMASVGFNKVADMFILKTALDNAYRLIKELP
jgi:hypothetical protein